MSQRFRISDDNPNPGGACVCSEKGDEDCVGPYAIFYATSTDDNANPHVVLSVDCAQAAVNAAFDEQTSPAEYEVQEALQRDIEANLADEEDIPEV